MKMGIETRIKTLDLRNQKWRLLAKHKLPDKKRSGRRSVEAEVYTLLLCENSLMTQHCSIIPAFSKLETLDLSRNSLDSGCIRPLLGKFHNLKVLNLSFNQLSHRITLSATPQLETLILSYNRIQEISFSSPATGLRKLDACHNKLTKLSYLHNLSSIRRLVLSYNKLCVLGKEWESIKTLEELDVCFNLISIVEFSGLSNLRLLYINRNELL